MTDLDLELNNKLLTKRFRKLYPIVIDIESGGLDPKTDALLEIAATSINCTIDGKLVVGETFHHHVLPFPGGMLHQESLAINKIDPYHPLRFAVEETEALNSLFAFIKQRAKAIDCSRAVLVGHNAWFDLAFIKEAAARNHIKSNIIHKCTVFDTATLSGLIYGETVLVRALQKAKITFDQNYSHSALYDAQKTAELFCKIVNSVSWPN